MGKGIGRIFFLIIIVAKGPTVYQLPCLSALSQLGKSNINFAASLWGGVSYEVHFTDKLKLREVVIYSLWWSEWNVPHSLRHLNLWSPAVGTVWGGVGDMVLLDQVCHCRRALKFSDLPPPSCLFSLLPVRGSGREPSVPSVQLQPHCLLPVGMLSLSSRPLTLRDCKSWIHPSFHSARRLYHRNRKP